MSKKNQGKNLKALGNKRVIPAHLISFNLWQPSGNSRGSCLCSDFNRGFPKIDHSGSSARIVQNKINSAS